MILSQPQNRPPAAIFGPEPSHGWCYYYEQAGLARQLGDWPKVAALGDTAFTLSDYPNGPLERLPFIEGYAHMQRWSTALKLTADTAKISPVTHPPLCALWARISSQTPASPEKDQALVDFKNSLSCTE
jgi:hypothetical protein